MYKYLVVPNLDPPAPAQESTWSHPSCSTCLSLLPKDKGGKFLEKLWCCVGGRVQQGNLVLSTELKTQIGHRKEFKG